MTSAPSKLYGDYQMKLVCALAIFLICSRAQSQCPQATMGYPSGQVASDAVLRRLSDVLDRLPNEPSKKDIDAQASKIFCLRAWANHLKPGCVKIAYLDWLDYYQQQVNRARSDLAKGVPPASTKIEAEWRERDRAAKEYARTHDIPAPPSCDLDLIREVSGTEKPKRQ